MPIPMINECMNSLEDTKFFSTLDANSEYCQILIAPKERGKTTFMTHFEMQVFMWFLFGLKNTSEKYLRTVETTLTTIK